MFSLSPDHSHFLVFSRFVLSPAAYHHRPTAYHFAHTFLSLTLRTSAAYHLPPPTYGIYSLSLSLARGYAFHALNPPYCALQPRRARTYILPVARIYQGFSN
ncbi:hypothetical protein FCM35_KLT00473 [Carex littledalei]|uniref:Uncharacterized protein n=1 Tax=Carex littledalei TaxID=544730 RepID=A0A833VTL7_9POAL|nr:hypothetical protein FCM35_KLT00473 [Carex littledalei]